MSSRSLGVKIQVIFHVCINLKILRFEINLKLFGDVNRFWRDFLRRLIILDLR